ncbi:MAG: hypothetical protein J7559_02140 [Cohnella sp.]|nr:hypothetical protein [Cohnella sp.]
MWPESVKRFLGRQVPIFTHLAAAKPGEFPFTCRGYGYRPSFESERLWLFILKTQWLRMKEYIEHSAELAALLTSGVDNESYQFKGRFAEIRGLSKEDIAALEEQRKWVFAQAPALAPLIHVSASDCVAVGLQVGAIYSQTPGPDAGSPAMERSDGE